MQKLREWDGKTFKAIIDNFANFALFGVSSTGCTSDEKGRYQNIMPRRVEDPLLWLLYRLNVIPGRHSEGQKR